VPQAATLPELFGRLVSASKKEEMADANRRAAEQFASWLARRISELEEDGRRLKEELERYRTQHHASFTHSQVLQSRLSAALQSAETAKRLDWLFNFLIAFGGVVAGFGISWPGLTYVSRSFIAAFGLIVILAPILFKVLFGPASR
jgi:hypothetical protein